MMVLKSLISLKTKLSLSIKIKASLKQTFNYYLLKLIRIARIKSKPFWVVMTLENSKKKNFSLIETLLIGCTWDDSDYDRHSSVKNKVLSV